MLAQPAQILLMRHGHKGEDHANYNLSPTGFQRAMDLAAVLPACFGKVDHILTYFLNQDTGKNARSYQTAVPLAIKSGVNIRIFKEAEVLMKQAGEKILADPNYGGANLIFIWEHRHLPELAAGLGWPTMPPIADNDFNRLYQLRYSKGSTKPTVRAFDQSLLLEGSESCADPKILQR
ncbi:histidine phosphatase family protein [Cyanobium sp. HWJ4-Hawea]|uniref:hypothetical protein n=1 Tax=Cyanobium sp. HWJ4-Hawea TaxID=2823713 RepID=UPI0020CC0279|nr:hypothetical protein [Cyanobium sp. HWJ4-Hawea]MCP9808200.1 histidine phosphatase family protein [Cyanobium sp. HWJ4-Hawea]